MESVFMQKILLSIILFLPCFIFAQENKQTQKDSLKKVITYSIDDKEKLDAYLKLTNIYYFEAIRDAQKRDTLMGLYDKMDTEAEKLGNVKARGIMRINRLNILVTTQQYDEVVKLAPGYLAFMEKTQLWNSYYYIYYSLVSAYRNQGKTVEATATANKMFEHAQEKENNIGMGIALFAMARIYNDQVRYSDEEKCLREAIVVLKDSALNKLVDVYGYLGACLVQQNRYEEAVQVADKMETVIKRYEEESGATILNAWLNQYMVYIDAYIELKQYDKAEIYCDKVEWMSNGAIIPYEARAAILASHGQYEEALEMADKAIEITFPKHKLETMMGKMTILLKKEGSENIEKLFREIIELQILGHNEEASAKLDEIRTQYEVEKVNAEKERMRLYLLLAISGCLLLVVMLAFYIYYHQLIRNKNKKLFSQIKAQDHLREELETMTKRYEEITQLIQPSVETEHAPSLQGNKQQRQLVERLHEYLLLDKNFTRNNIERDELVRVLATNKTYLYEAIKAVSDETPQEYINRLRLEEARRMLEKRSEFTIETIAEDCGFNSARTFYRLFREYYHITPAEYRRLVRD